MEYLRGLKVFDEDFLEYLKAFISPAISTPSRKAPLSSPGSRWIKVVAPIMEAQLVETAILTILNHQSLIATKAARVVYAAKGDGIMELVFAAPQGPDAGVYGARAAVIGGCVGTSNVLCGQLFDVPVKGNPRPQLDHEFPG